MMLFLILVVQISQAEAETVPYRMILPGVVYEEIMADQGEWMGLFMLDCGRCMLRPVDMLLEPEEGTFYEGERPAGWVVSLPEEEDRPLVLLMSADSVLSPGPVEVLVGTRTALLVDTSFVLQSEGIRQTDFITSSEGLRISSGGVSQLVSQTFPGEGPNAPFMNLIWAGDLDGDGRIDLILDDVDNDYLVYSWDLYLSSAAPDDRLVEKVAWFFDVYY